jgi:hypothetical protein
MTPAQVESQVESWNWNMNIFEIYDELRDNHTSQQQEQLLTHAYKFFNKDSSILKLANHFGIYSIEE